jgi:archaellum biogenesis ATPase FlaH
MPELYIITGSNGAGKSSLGVNYLPGFLSGLPVLQKETAILPDWFKKYLPGMNKLIQEYFYEH